MGPRGDAGDGNGLAAAQGDGPAALDRAALVPVEGVPRAGGAPALQSKVHPEGELPRRITGSGDPLGDGQLAGGVAGTGARVRTGAGLFLLGVGEGRFDGLAGCDDACRPLGLHLISVVSALGHGVFGPGGQALGRLALAVLQGKGGDAVLEGHAAVDAVNSLIIQRHGKGEVLIPIRPAPGDGLGNGQVPHLRVGKDHLFTSLDFTAGGVGLLPVYAGHEIVVWFFRHSIPGPHRQTADGDGLVAAQGKGLPARNGSRGPIALFGRVEICQRLAVFLFQLDLKLKCLLAAAHDLLFHGQRFGDLAGNGGGHGGQGELHPAGGAGQAALGVEEGQGILSRALLFDVIPQIHVLAHRAVDAADVAHQLAFFGLLVRQEHPHVVVAEEIVLQGAAVVRRQVKFDGVLHPEQVVVINTVVADGPLAFSASPNKVLTIITVPSVRIVILYLIHWPEIVGPNRFSKFCAIAVCSELRKFLQVFQNRSVRICHSCQGVGIA